MDDAGRPVASAAVTLLRQETNKKRTAFTTASGEFLFTVTPPGSYQLEVEHAGYRKHVQRLILQLNEELRVEVPLLPGQMS